MEDYIFIALAALVVGLFLGRFVFPYKPSDGVFEVSEGAKTIFQLEINSDPKSLARKKQVVFDIVKKGPEAS